MRDFHLLATAAVVAVAGIAGATAADGGHGARGHGDPALALGLDASGRDGTARGGSGPVVQAQGPTMPGQGGMMGQGGMGRQSPLMNLKELPSERTVKAVRYCERKYLVTTAAGDILEFPEFNLRIKTDASELGPRPGVPGLLHAGMMGDRAFLVFADPAEISGYIEKKCDGG
jgi:hypothetical protein